MANNIRTRSTINNQEADNKNEAISQMQISVVKQ